MTAPVTGAVAPADVRMGLPLLEKRSVSLAGHRTSVALEPEYWAVVERLAGERSLSVSGFVGLVDRTRGGRNLASALRVAVLNALLERLP